MGVGHRKDWSIQQTTWIKTTFYSTNVLKKYACGINHLELEELTGYRTPLLVFINTLLPPPLILFRLFSSASPARGVETYTETICRLLSSILLMIPPREAFRTEQHLVGRDADEAGWLNVPGVPDEPSLLRDGWRCPQRGGRLFWIRRLTVAVSRRGAISGGLLNTLVFIYTFIKRHHPPPSNNQTNCFHQQSEVTIACSHSLHKAVSKQPNPHAPNS